MKLQEQTLSVDFGQGLDQKTDPKSVVPGKMIALQNARFNKSGRLSKRYGTVQKGAYPSAQSYPFSPSLTYPDVGHFTKIKSNGNTLVAFTDPKTETTTFPADANAATLFGVPVGTIVPTTPAPGGLPTQYLLAGDAWRRGGPVCAVPSQSVAFLGSAPAVSEAFSTSVFSGSVNDYDSASNGSVTLAARSIVDGAGNSSLVFTVYDDDNDSVIVQDQVLLGSAKNVKVLALPGSDFIFIVCGNGFGAGLARYQVSTNVLTASAVAFPSLFTGFFDAVIMPNGGAGVMFVAYQTGAAQAKLSRIDLSTLALSTVTVVTAGTFLGIWLCVPSTNSDTIRLFTNDSSSGLRMGNFSTTTLATLIAMTVVNATAKNSTVTQVAAIEFVYYPGVPAFNFPACHTFLSMVISGKETLFYFSVINSGAVIAASGVSTSAFNLQPVSKPILINGVPYLLCAFTSTLQNSYFLVFAETFNIPIGNVAANPSIAFNTQTSILPAARSLYQTGAGRLSASSLASPKNLQPWGDREIRTIASQAESDNTTLSGVTNKIVNLRYGLDPSKGYSDIQVGTNLLISGGFDLEFDGVSCYERGFLTFPELFTVTAATSGGLLPDGVYDVILIYEWSDQLGQLCQSETSEVVSVTISGGTGHGRIDISDTGPALSMRRDSPLPRTPIRIIAYCTVASGMSFYRTIEVTQSTPSATFIVSITSIATTNGLIYTQGGSLDNFTPDSSRAKCLSKDRVVFADPTDPSLVHDGKAIESGLTAGIAPESQLRINYGGGPVLALAFMDDKIVASKSIGLFVCYGEGPNDLGQNGTRTGFQQVSYSAGAVHQDAGAVIPQGYIFQTPRNGIWLLGRDLATTYIGAAVEDFNGIEVLKTVVVDEQKEVRFLLADYSVLIYNYFFNQWSTIPSWSVIDCCVEDGKFVVVRVNDGIHERVYVETPGVFTDAHITGGEIALGFKTGLLSFSSKQSVKRLWATQFIGDFKSSHTANVWCDYDNEQTFEEDHSLSSAMITKGDGDYQFEVGHGRQLIRSVQYKFLETNPTGEDLSLTAMEMKVGVLPGLSRLRAEKRN